MNHSSILRYGHINHLYLSTTHLSHVWAFDILYQHQPQAMETMTLTFQNGRAQNSSSKNKLLTHVYIPLKVSIPPYLRQFSKTHLLLFNIEHTVHLHHESVTQKPGKNTLWDR